LNADDILNAQYDELPPETEPPSNWDQDANLPVDTKTQSHQKRWTAAELLDATFPEPKWAIQRD
jgi:hypothetical protein